MYQNIPKDTQGTFVDKYHIDNTFISLNNSLRPTDAYMRQEISMIGSDKGLAPGRRQALIWTDDGILLIRPLGTYFSEISIEIRISSLKKYIGKYRLRNVGRFVLASMW